MSRRVALTITVEPFDRMPASVYMVEAMKALLEDPEFCLGTDKMPSMLVMPAATARIEWTSEWTDGDQVHRDGFGREEAIAKMTGPEIARVLLANPRLYTETLIELAGRVAQ